MLKFYDVLANEKLTDILKKAQINGIKLLPEVWGHIVGITTADDITNSMVNVIQNLIENLTYVAITDNGEIALTLADDVQTENLIGAQITTLRVAKIDNAWVMINYYTRDRTILTAVQEAVLKAFIYAMITVLTDGGEKTYNWEMITDTDATEITDPAGTIALERDVNAIQTFWTTLPIATTGIEQTVPTQV